MGRFEAVAGSDVAPKVEFSQGLIESITKVGKKLKEFFPYQSDGTNELSDSTLTQIVEVTVETIKGEVIGVLTPKRDHKWGIG